MSELMPHLLPTEAVRYDDDGGGDNAVIIREGLKFSEFTAKERHRMMTKNAKLSGICVLVLAIFAVQVGVFALSLYYAITSIGDACMKSDSSMRMPLPLTTILIIVVSCDALFECMFLVPSWGQSLWLYGFRTCVEIAEVICIGCSLFGDSIDCISNGLGVMSIIQFIMHVVLFFKHVCVDA